MSQSNSIRTQQITVFSVLYAISLVHLLNDTIQSVVPAIFPIIRTSLNLSFGQIGLIALAMNLTASLFQPFIGFYTDKRPLPYMLPIGVLFTLTGVVFLALAGSFSAMIVAVILIGLGSSILHPESSRVAYLAAGPRRGLAQSIFQVGGNIGSSLGPILTALIFVPLGQYGVIWFTFAAAGAFIVQMFVAKWYKTHIANRPKASRTIRAAKPLSRKMITYSMVILIMMLFSKFVYLASMTGYYAFFLMDHFKLSNGRAQLFIFALLAAGTVGTFMGGPIADRFGRRNTIWFSILGTAPFSILLPYANEFFSAVLCICVGFILHIGFSVIVVYAQELLPGKVGTVSGLFFGVAFGLGGIGSAILGSLADSMGISFIIQICAFLPLIGLLAALLPTDSKLNAAAAIETTA
ncbi:fosmidomycin resistance protein [Paenibacillus baekrokdamisoli]|uniref:Fosmidomycin resistance protein n=1 Tax=Paenibacillus baekrokdamisoli TaxID=1712516 RepID=A0A3G9IQJ5_9BACL|nr:MFS transporter [Paenibacillus baekrokdamisoli]MBB3070136.1 FSR family fosmidomycin resistance protein-like MFS transporter [Paenibacillus baekrokdamisoli]BBH21147.1 fosmidomycin resistance protein [Paenibacillus baekrokdamisoli]